MICQTCGLDKKCCRKCILFCSIFWWSIMDNIRTIPSCDMLRIIIISTRFLGAATCRWWTRGESNPCPKTSWYDLLRGQSVFIISHYASPTDRQYTVRSTFVLDRFRCDHRCKFTTTMTLSPQSWSSAEERVTRRSQHCQSARPKARQLGSHSNSIVVV